jgi:hypothetical protein
MIEEETISTITANLLDCYYNENLFATLKEFILEHYKRNHLLQKMCSIDPNNSTGDLFHVYKEILEDVERLYLSSIDYKLEFFHRHGKLLPQYLYDKMQIFIKCFPYNLEVIENIFDNELGDDFIRLVHKYYVISSNTTLRSGETGTVCFTFEVGDFILKYITASHNIYGIDYPCPSNFLINKVYEEISSYDSHGNFLGRLQVQPKLLVPLLENQTDILEQYSNELRKLGYFCDDLEPCNHTYNVYRLKSYQDADCDDSENLPEWFKENPYVLVDRDCVYPLDKEEEVNRVHREFIKQLEKR